MEPRISKSALKSIVDAETAIAKVYYFRKLPLGICELSHQYLSKTFRRWWLHIRQKFSDTYACYTYGNLIIRNVTTLIFKKKFQFITFMTDPCRLDRRREKSKILISKTSIWSLGFPLGSVDLNIIHIKPSAYYVTMWRLWNLEEFVFVFLFPELIAVNSGQK